MQERIKQAILNFLRPSEPGKILDIPSGTGWLQKELKPGWEYHGADLYTSPGVANFKQADLNSSLPYEDNSFEYVSCLEGLEHIENYHLALKEFYRILKPGGVLVVSTPNPLNIKSRRRYMWRGTFNGFPHLVRMPKDGDHVHVTPINLSFLLAFGQKHGFDINEVHKVKIPTRMWRFAPRALLVRFYSWMKFRTKDEGTQEWMGQVNSWNVLLNDGMVVSFKKPVEC